MSAKLVKFMASRLGGRKTGRVSRPAIVIATASVAMGLMVMVLTLCVTHGFKTEIRQQVRNIGGDFQILNTAALNDGATPLLMTASQVEQIRHFNGVERAHRVVNKLGCLKMDSAFIGIQLVGIEQDSACAQRFVRYKASNDAEAVGCKPEQLKDNEIIISTKQASQLRLSAGDKVMAYFFDENIRARRFVVAGTYATNMSDFDDMQVFASYSTVHALTSYGDEECSLVMLYLTGDANVASLRDCVRQLSPTTPHSQCSLVALDELHPQVFSWLQLLDVNVWIILALMVCVAGFTMASSLFILILERTQMIGVMKALGASFGTLRSVFLYIAAVILLRGMIIGNALAFLLVFVQRQWQVFHLDPADYYVDAIPVAVPWVQVALVNLATICITIVILIVPTFVINRIKPVKALRFD